MALPTTLRETAPRRPRPTLTDTLRDAANGPYRYLVLLSHMRSYSSVLAHVLGSSPEVEGSGETHVRYRNALDLWRLRRRIRETTGRPLQGRWLLDKVLHNEVRPIDRFVGRERLRVLVFLRRPESALASMMHLARQRGGGARFADPQACCDYYVSRLHRLRADGERYGRDALYFDAEAMVDQPHALLAEVADWVGLAAPLSTRYRLAASTGVEGYGDWLPNIRRGEVLGREASTVREPLPLDATVLAEARGAYERCRTALMRSCSVAPVTGRA